MGGIRGTAEVTMGRAMFKINLTGAFGSVSHLPWSARHCRLGAAFSEGRGPSTGASAVSVQGESLPAGSGEWSLWRERVSGMVPPREEGLGNTYPLVNEMTEAGLALLESRMLPVLLNGCRLCFLCSPVTVRTAFF